MCKEKRIFDENFTATCDRFIEETERRRNGDFYTPKIWVDEAHKLITKELGEDWKEKYVVWDCCCGTKNLTRGYEFKRLYSSTIKEGDIKIGKRYNKLNDEYYHSVSFVYDFLNEDVKLFEELLREKNEGKQLTLIDFANSTLYKEAQGLLKAMLDSKPLFFLINPPYGTAKNGGTDSISKVGIADTKVNAVMKKEKIGASSQQLYIQFLYRIYKLKQLFDIDIRIGLFSPPAFITGSSFKGFRDIVRKDFSVEKGFILQANQFADLKDSWGISFTLLGPTGTFDDVMLKILELNTMGEVVTSSETQHLFYNLDTLQSLSDWIKEKGVGEDAPQVTNALKIKPTGRGRLLPNSLGYILFNANNIETSKQYVAIASSCFAGAHGYSILESNFDKAMCGFAARRIMANNSNWINWQDEFLKPNVEDIRYNSFVSDSIIYSLFNPKSNQSALRTIFYKDKFWNVKNEFFFMSEQEMLDLSRGKLNREDKNIEVEEDLVNFPNERFVYKKLQEVTLSKEAQAVLDKAKELVRLSFKYREDFDIDHKEYKINTWDAGWYQIKGLLKEYYPEELKKFNTLYKELEEKMRPMVYELGFLRK